VPLISARVEEILVKIGEQVEQGELLARLDDNQLQQLEIQFQNLQKNYQRMQQLHSSGSIDQQSFEEVESAYLSMQKSLENLRENTEIRAPISGTISGVNAQVGEIFSSMQQPYFIRIINYEEMLVLLQLSQSAASRVVPGMSAQIFADDESYLSEAEVAYVAPEADMMSGTVEVGLRLKQVKNLKHNQFVRTRLILESEKSALVVPRTAVLDQKKIFVIKAGKVLERTVSLGLSNEKEYQVISGVEKSEMVVTVGNIGLRAGDAVEIVK